MYIIKFVRCLFSPYPSLIAIYPPLSHSLWLYVHSLYFEIQFLLTPLSLFLHLKIPTPPPPPPSEKRKLTFWPFSPLTSPHFSINLSIPHTTLNIYVSYAFSSRETSSTLRLTWSPSDQREQICIYDGKEKSSPTTGLGQPIWVSNHIHYSTTSQSRYWLYSYLPEIENHVPIQQVSLATEWDKDLELEAVWSRAH